MTSEKTGQRHKNKVYFKDQDLDLYLQAFSLNHLSYGGWQQRATRRRRSGRPSLSSTTWSIPRRRCAF